MRTRILITAAVAVLLLGAGLAAVRLLGGPDTTLARAVALAPADSQRYTFTDWAAVRGEVGVAASEADLTELLDAGFDADLTAASGLVGSADLLSAEYGWSPATVAWELLAQGPEGAVQIVSLGSVSPDTVTGRLEALGYERPSEDDGVWVGGTQLLAELSGRTGLSATPTLQYVAVREGLLWASDRQPYLEAALADDALAYAPLLFHALGLAPPPPRSSTPGTTPATRSRWAGPTTTTGPPPTSCSTGRARSTRSPPSRWACCPTGTPRCCSASRTTTRPAPTPTPARSSPPDRRPARAGTSPTGSPCAR